MVGFSSFTLALVHEAPAATIKIMNKRVLISIEDDSFMGTVIRMSGVVYKKAGGAARG
jgi:hypothetical protein